MAERDEAAASGEGEEHAAAEPSSAAPAASEPARDTPARPAPQFGEYAPDGWSWSPESGSPAAETAPGGAAPLANAATPPSTGRVPGVPHNLGAAGGSPAPAPAPASDRTAAQASDDSAAAPPGGRQEQHYRGQPQPGAAGRRLGDRIVTIVLLALGALGALNTAASLQQLPRSFRLLADALEIDGLAIPAAVQTLGTVGALVVLALYAVTLIYSIQRMRRHRLTFWVPLVAGVIAFIVTVAVTSFGLTQVPELATHFAEPGASEKLLEYFGGAGSGTP